MTFYAFGIQGIEVFNNNVQLFFEVGVNILRRAQIGLGARMSQLTALEIILRSLLTPENGCSQD